MIKLKRIDFKKINLKKKKTEKIENTENKKSRKFNLKGLSNIFSKITGRIRLGIRSKLIATFLFPVIFIILLGVISYNQTADSLEELYQTSSMQILGKSADYLEVVLLNVETVAYDISADTEVVNFFSGTPDEGVDYEYIDKKIYTWLATDTYVESGYFISTKLGKHISTNDSVSFDADAYSKFEQTKDYVEVTSRNRKVWIGESEFLQMYKPAAENPYDNRKLTLIRRVENILTGEDVGYVILEVRTNVMEELLSEINLGEGSEVLLVAQDNTEIMKMDRYPESVEETAITGTKSYTKIQQSIEKNGSWNMNMNGDKYWMCYYYLGDLGDVIIGFIPQKTIMAEANGIRNTTVLIVIFAAAMVTVIGAFMAQGMSSTIKNIVKGVAKASKGDLTVNIKVNRKDEFGKLAGSVNDMIAAMKGLIGKVSDGVAQVEEAADKVSEAKEIVSEAASGLVDIGAQIRAGSSSQEDGAGECAQNMDTLSAKIEEVSDSTEHIEEIAKTTNSLVGEGIRAMDELSKSSTQTTENLTHISEEIQVLADKVNNIHNIIAVITEIADQTNLLSLNASIEAARAGEQGRGFAVVASEVKKLADESLSATEQIGQIINEVQQQSQKTMHYTEAAGDILAKQEEAVASAVSTFENINEYVRKLDEDINIIAKQTDAMDDSKNSTIEAIHSITAVIEENSASVSEMEESISYQKGQIETLSGYAENLQKVSQQLTDAINIFTIDSTV